MVIAFLLFGLILGFVALLVFGESTTVYQSITGEEDPELLPHPDDLEV